MKINQLFVKHVTTDILQVVMQAFGLGGLDDRRSFSKLDMQEMGTVEKIRELVPQLRDYYLPCKARVYLENITEKKAITILKQMLRLHAHTLMSRERNARHRKVILYQIVNDQERRSLQHIEVHHNDVNLTF
jgi:hypothetical protein